MTPMAPVCSHPSLPSCQGTLTPAIPEFFFSHPRAVESPVLCAHRAGSRARDHSARVCPTIATAVWAPWPELGARTVRWTSDMDMCLQLLLGLCSRPFSGGRAILSLRLCQSLGDLQVGGHGVGKEVPAAESAQYVLETCRCNGGNQAFLGPKRVRGYV